MGKTKTNDIKIKSDNIINPDIEYKFKMLLKIMSWVVGTCFVLMIILPLFDSYFFDVIVKILYFIGLINLILFAILEFFGQNIKIYLTKK